MLHRQNILFPAFQPLCRLRQRCAGGTLANQTRVGVPGPRATVPKKPDFGFFWDHCGFGTHGTWLTFADSVGKPGGGSSSFVGQKQIPVGLGMPGHGWPGCKFPPETPLSLLGGKSPWAGGSRPPRFSGTHPTTVYPRGPRYQGHAFPQLGFGGTKKPKNAGIGCRGPGQSSSGGGGSPWGAGGPPAKAGPIFPGKGK